MKLDCVVIGAGLAGATFAQQAKERGKSVLVVDKRDHVGGNCATEYRDGIHIHRYGGHILHTNDDDLWEYINRFARIRQYTHKVKVNYRDKMYSFPINLETYHQVFSGWADQVAPGVFGRMIREGMVPDLPFMAPDTKRTGDSLEDWCINQVGHEMYRIFIEGYTTKQWGRHPRDLPASIIKRIPVRTTWDDRYFSDKYQGVPENGYTVMVWNMLDGVQVELGVDYFANRERLDGIAQQVVYTGEIDRYFGHRLGHLDYRSLRHEHRRFDGDIQGCATINYTSADVPYTRILEHKHYGWLGSHLDKTWVTWEYPAEYDGTNVPMYPIRDEKNTELYRKYKDLTMSLKDTRFIGRLATYQYWNMDQVIAQALMLAKEIL